LPIDEFSLTKNRGIPYRLKRCKTCTAEYKRAHYLEHQEKYKQRSQKNHHDNREEINRKQREKWHENKEEFNKKSREYSTSERGRELNRLRSRKYRRTSEGAKKDRARSYLSFAIRDGDIARPSNCEKCGVECSPEGHHIDYDKPLEVIWLCKSCHENIHHSNEGHVS
jgi:hypothetical protein